jgi:hypothetical protein
MPSVEIGVARPPIANAGSRRQRVDAFRRSGDLHAVHDVVHASGAAPS